MKNLQIKRRSKPWLPFLESIPAIAATIHGYFGITTLAKEGGSPCLDVLIYFCEGIVPIIVSTNTLSVAPPVGIMSNSTGSPAAAAVIGSKILSFLAKKGPVLSAFAGGYYYCRE